MIGLNVGYYLLIFQNAEVLHIGNAPYTGSYSIAGMKFENLVPFSYRHIVRKAYHILGLICKSFECKDSDIMVKLYKPQL